MARKPFNPKKLLLPVFVLLLAALFMRLGPTYLPPMPATPPETVALQAVDWSAGPGLVAMHSIDVGQGDASLLVFPDGKTILVDAGNNGKGKAILAYLDQIGVQQIDWLVATNPDADHVGGVDDVVEGIPVKNFLDPGVNCVTKTCRDNDAALAKAGILKTFAHRGEALDLGDGFKVGILNPTKPLSFDKENNNSIVLFVDTQGKDFLLPGDCEKECEAQLVQAFGDQLKADVYKAGHHGSRTSSTQEFLDQIKPSIPGVSAGKDNRWGHPHPETLEKLRTMNARALRTDELGNIALYSDPAQGCCQECRESLSRDPRGVGPSGIACASYGSQLSLLCRGQFEAAPKTAAECLAS